ncbi:L-lactate dehydrogenase, partial [Salmonella enterica subsp. enterica serovar Enteritidis str. 13183-1]
GDSLVQELGKSLPAALAPMSKGDTLQASAQPLSPALDQTIWLNFRERQS